MRVKCADCGKRYKIQDSLVSPEGIRIRCPNCNCIFPVYPQTDSGEAGTETTEDTSKVSDGETTPYSETEVADDGFEDEAELGETDLHRERAVVEETHVRADQLDEFESSLPAEISQVSFDSDISFEEEISDEFAKRDTPVEVATQETTPQKPAHSQARTAINPNLPPRSNPRATPTPPRLSPQTPSMRDVRAAEVPSRRGNKVAIGFALLVLMGTAAYYTAKHFEFDLRRFFSSQSQNNQVVNATATPSPTAVAEKLPIPARELNEIEAALSFLTKDSIDYACSRLKKYLPSPLVQAKLSYCLSIAWLFFNDQAAGERARSISTTALLGGARGMDVVFAAGVGLTKGQIDTFDASLKQWNLPDSIESKPDYNFLLAIASFEKRKYSQANIYINKAKSQKPEFGPYVAFEKTISYALKNEPAKPIDMALVRLRNDVLEDFPSFRVFLPKPTQKVSKPPKKRTAKKPKPRAKPKPTPKPKPTAAPTPEPTAKAQDPRQQLIDLGDSHFRNEKYNQALKAYQAAEKLGDGKDAALLTRLGNTWFRMYRLDEAFATYSKALELDPNQANAHKGLGRVFDHLGDSEQAIREFSIYLQLNPKAKDAAAIKKTLDKLKQ